MKLERREHDRAADTLGALFGGVLVVGAALGAVWLRLGLPRPVCYFRNVTGVPCPTCGSTRLFEALLAGDIADALASNPLVFVGGIAVALWAGLSTVRLLFKLPRWHPIFNTVERRLLRILAVAILIAGWSYLILK